MPKRPVLLITGASGYIGRRLSEIAVQRGCDVTALGSAPCIGRPVRTFPWRLGDEPIAAALEGVSAIIHLGHSWVSDSREQASSANINVSGSEKLARAALTAGVPRFVFASTTSARPSSLNAYGRVKYAVEQRLI